MQLDYTIFIKNNHAPVHLWQNLVNQQKILKYYKQDWVLPCFC